MYACVCVCVVASSFHSVNEIKLTVTLVFIFFYRCFYSISLLFYFYDRIPTDNHNNCVIQFSILSFCASLSRSLSLSFCVSPFSHLLWANEHFFCHISGAFHHFVFCPSLSLSHYSLSCLSSLHSYFFYVRFALPLEYLSHNIFIFDGKVLFVLYTTDFAVLTWGICVA